MKRFIYFLAPFLIFSIFLFAKKGTTEVASTYSYIPPFITNSVPPMVMLTMARDHRLYYEAYNDASDINGDGILDVRYNPLIDYYGYFDSYKYYEYVTTGNGRFEPRGVTTNKKAPAGNYWSGDFLNYVSMTRMDCLRKVLYGGFRSTDTATETVLERAFIPQDAHSFGKEYDSIARDGFDIQEYTPLGLPTSGRRHLIATTALGNYNPTASPPTGLPILRVLQNSSSRIWEWVATERPVVKSNFGGNTTPPPNPTTKAEFDTLVSTYAILSNQFGSGPQETIDIYGNPHGTSDTYLTMVTGEIRVTTAGLYFFSINGDDCIDFRINGVTWANATGVTVTGDTIGWYQAGGHGADSNNGAHRASTYLAVGTYTIEYRHEEHYGGDSLRLYYYTGNSNITASRLNDSSNWTILPVKTGSRPVGLRNLNLTTYNLLPSAVIDDYTLRVKVGVTGMPESNCKLYPNGTYKPLGVLQRHGESNSMYFGLLTGSYTKNLSGGVLRQQIGSITREINTNTGEFLYMDNSTVGGIVRTLDRLQIHGFRNDANFDYNEDCGWIATEPLTEGKCRMWGNPMAEMMYETTRYFAGKGSPTSNFTYTYSTSTSDTLDDNQLGLPLSSWNNPYNSTNYCSKPIMLAISDIYPSYDSDQLPGSAWNSTFPTGGLTGLDVNARVLNIANYEGVNGSHFIGQNGAPGITGYDGACTPKNIPGFEDIRGLCPEEPSKQGSYYSAAVTHYAATNASIGVINATVSSQHMASYMVALSSPLPEIKIPVGGNVITMVPFAKSVGGYSISNATGVFQPTNTIVDFFVEEITPTTGTFRVNFEDVEQGADHDMDAIVRYTYEVVGNSTVSITLTSEYAAGSIIQHMGYIISGTTADGTYLVVRDKDTDADDDPDYHLDVPNTSDALPLYDSRSFSPGSTAGANLLKNPLWYAAKWGGFEDSNGNGRPDLQSEWDKDNDGVPDTYFFVANPTKLEEQLNNAFADILRRTASGTAASVISQSREGRGAVYQSIFYPEFKDTYGNSINWVGQAHSLFVDNSANIREDTNSNTQLDIADKYIVYHDTNIFRYTDSNADGVLSASEASATIELLTGPQDIKFLWSSSPWLNSIDDASVVAQRSQYNATTANRYIFTFADKNNNMIVDTNEIQDFVWPPNSPVNTPNAFLNNSTDFYSYLTLYPSFSNSPYTGNFTTAGFGSLLWKLAERQIDYIRGADQNATTVGVYALNATRSRQYALTSTQDLTWRLGDIVYSTPTVVAAPSESYNLLYLDKTYETFLKQYANRRQMVYVGANDGMIHAFNGGFYNSTRTGFDTASPGKVAFPLGMEVWGYIPYNLLPHLYWLTDSSYGSQLHVSYMDLKPRVFDARVFFLSDGATPADDDHPGGWGTVMVAGMRMGGGQIRADLDKTDGNSNATIDRTLGSAYVIMDITNPEKKPTVLGEIRLPGQGFTTCYPTVMPMTTANTNSTALNQWYLVFGSGPANALGQPDPAQLSVQTSSQNGKLFVLDLKSLVAHKTLKTLDTTGQFTSAGSHFATTEVASFITDPIAADLDLGTNNASAEFKADVVYYGTVAGDQTNGFGTMRRLTTNNALASSGIVTGWIGNSTLIDVQKPITGAASLAMDENKRLWVYFGAGRFFNRGDIPQVKHMSFFGVREPESGGVKTWGTVAAADLYNSTQITITNGTCVGGVYNRDCVRVYKSGTLLSGGWNALTAEVNVTPGWRQDFADASARVLGQPATLGGAVLFTAYHPSLDPCAFEGNSTLWALYYKTGTAYYNPIFRNGSSPFSTFVDLGRGLAITPNIHVGDKEGSTAFIQTSTGAIETIEIANPYSVKSGSLFWLKCQDD